MKLLRRVIILILALLLALAGGFAYWGSTPYAPMPEALAALVSDSQVSVKTSPWLEFAPAGRSDRTGLILYPGAHVDPRAYAPLARALAARGYLVAVPSMPLNLALLGVEKAAEIIAAHPEIRHWAVGGHSLGGVAAARYAREHPAQIEGILFLASYPASGDSLAQSNLQATSIYATLDGLATGTKIDASRSLLPSRARWVRIVGGDHAQFGWYGVQPGDNPAAISRQAQQDQVAAAAAQLLAQLDAQS